MTGDTTPLDRFESPAEHVATFETDELTALCPFDFGGPDFYEVTLRYRPAEYCVESKSLKQYLRSFRDREISAEALAAEIAAEVRETIEPKALYLRLEQARRGGITETVEVGDREFC
jgi:7-cyano-7-deazaguanine reductase